ncbi:MAG: TetR/AcrR family transcriptional regulator [Myxococcota bacterium]
MTRALLQLRRQPSQARSQETFEDILKAASELLDDVGWDGFNTNLLAQRAGVAVRAVYRYFPNKLAVVSTLAQRMAEEWDGWFQNFEKMADHESSWREIWPNYIDVFIEGVRAQPGGLAIRRAMQASPALQAIDQEDNERLAMMFARALRRRQASISLRDARTAGRLLVETAVTIIDLAMAAPPNEQRRLIDELKTMQVAYLDQCQRRWGNS